MNRNRSLFAIAFLLGVVALPYAQSEKLDYQAIGRIRDEGLTRSQVMDTVSWLSDVYGPRLTGSPAIQQASEWAMKQFTEWGPSTSIRSSAFGKGWSLVRSSATLVEPQVRSRIRTPGPLAPKALTADVVRV